jgi:hypothetical protein
MTPGAGPGIDGYIDLVDPGGGLALNQTLLVQGKASNRPIPYQRILLISAHPLDQELPQPPALASAGGAGRECAGWPPHLVVTFAGAGRRRPRGAGLPAGRGVSWC